MRQGVSPVLRDVQEFCIGVRSLTAFSPHQKFVTKMLQAERYVVECARDASQSGQTLSMPDDLRAQYGVVVNQLTSTVMQGAVGRTRIQDLTRPYVNPRTLLGNCCCELTDHQDEAGLWGSFKSDTDKASRNVLVFHWRMMLESSYALRTEPKFKVYGECIGDDVETV